MRRIVAIAVLAGCTDNTVIVTPIVDIPVNDDAQALELDSITMSVAHAGATENIQSATFVHGDVIELPNVPFGDDLVVHMIGRQDSSDVAYGRTCVFAVRPDSRVPSPHLFFAKNQNFGLLTQQPLRRLGGMAMMYRDGSGLLIGGSYPDDSNTPQALTQIERFDPNTGEYDTLHEVERRVDPAIAIVGTGKESRMVIVGGLDTSINRGAEFVEVIEAERNTDRQYEKFFEPGMARTALTATTLSDGRAVVIGGLTPGSTPSNLVHIVEVATTTTRVSQLPNVFLKYPRYGHTATRITDALGAPVLVAGGRDVMGNPIKEAELFKPLAPGFSPQFTATMIVPRWEHRAVGLPDGSVLFIGGMTINAISGQTELVDKLELFSPLDGRFVDVTDPFDMTIRATMGRIGMSATALPDGRILITGGRRTIDGEPIREAFIAQLDPKDGTVDLLRTDPLAVPRSGHQATLLCDGTVLISGGVVGFDAPFERYNPPAGNRR